MLTPVNIPKFCSTKFNRYELLFTSFSSGIISTREMYRKVPAINKKLQLDNISIPPIKRPTTTPIKHNTLDNILNKIAFLIETPVRLKTAKSPISCGSSWQNTAIVVPKPAVKLVANDAPIAKPSLKLCSPIIINN